MTTFNISSRPRSSHSTVLHIKANPKERSGKKADNEKRILAAAQSHFPGEVVEITTNPDDQSFGRSEEHTSELQSLMRISYAVFCLKKKKHTITKNTDNINIH